VWVQKTDVHASVECLVDGCRGHDDDVEYIRIDSLLAVYCLRIWRLGAYKVIGPYSV
jgi:hypothetical protein